MKPGTFTRWVASALLSSTGWSQLALAATPAQLLAQYSAQAGRSALPERGKALFSSRHTGTWSCASCHGVQPVGVGQHASTGRPIQPLAPGFNPERFIDSDKVEKWFRRNCTDVLGRECSAAEKADVLSWLISLKP